MAKMSPKDRQLLLDYLAANFGPSSKKRVLAIDADMPLDEAALGSIGRLGVVSPVSPPCVT